MASISPARKHSGEIADADTTYKTRRWDRLLASGGRTFLVLQFLDNASLLLFSWNEQLRMIRLYDHFPTAVVSLLMAMAIVLQTVCSINVILLNHTVPSAWALMVFNVTRQLWQETHFGIFERCAGLLGGFLLVIARCSEQGYETSSAAAAEFMGDKDYMAVGNKRSLLARFCLVVLFGYHLLDPTIIFKGPVVVPFFAIVLLMLLLLVFGKWTRRCSQWLAFLLLVTAWLCYPY